MTGPATVTPLELPAEDVALDANELAALDELALDAIELDATELATDVELATDDATELALVAIELTEDLLAVEDAGAIELVFDATELAALDELLAETELVLAAFDDRLDVDAALDATACDELAEEILVTDEARLLLVTTTLDVCAKTDFMVDQFSASSPALMPYK